MPTPLLDLPNRPFKPFTTVLPVGILKNKNPNPNVN
jgi:hypothetical protein